MRRMVELSRPLRAQDDACSPLNASFRDSSVTISRLGTAGVGREHTIYGGT